MQAQEPRPPFLGLWTRLHGFRRDDLHRALHERDDRARHADARHAAPDERGRLRRAPHDPAADADASRWRCWATRAEGLDAEEVLPVARALLDERPRTFGELRAALVEAFPGVNDRALGFTVRMELPLVMIPTEDRWGFPADSRFGLAEDWLGTPLCRLTANLEALILRYLAAFGPATAADVQQWSGLQGMKPVLEALRPQLAVVPGRARPDAVRSARCAAAGGGDPGAAALPAGVRQSAALARRPHAACLPDEYRRLVLGAKNGRIPGTFLVDGFVAGTWRVERKQAGGHAHHHAVRPAAEERRRRARARKGRRCCASWRRTPPPST